MQQFVDPETRVADEHCSMWSETTDYLNRLRDRYDMRLAVDVSYRGIYSDVRDEWAGVGALGLDLFKVFGGKRGDQGTLIFQPYLTRIDNLAAHAPFFEDNHDWELVFRIANFNYTGLAHGRLNFRIGHFEIPYGLEHVINTNGTLRDFIHGRNLGVKADWGIGINGDLKGSEYEVTLSRGTGNEYTNRDDPFVVAGRLGSDRDEPIAVGMSAFHGEVLNPGAVGIWRSGFDGITPAPDVGKIIRRTRFGADVRIQGNYLDYLLEGSYGRDYDQEVIAMLGEIDWRSPSERNLLYLQAKSFLQEFDTGWVDDVSLAVGARHTPDEPSSFSVQLVQGLSNFANSERDTVIIAQFRYRL